ncbi:MAG: nitrous oxide reductase family maturation protein NosD [bacterium]|nr:nitrous oxide reductase family maturation protein NosD [bacterium]
MEMTGLFKGAGKILCPLIFLFAAIDSQAALIEVGEGKSFSTIQQAVGKASNGDIIEVWEGIYPETLIVDKSITMKGVERPTIDGGGAGHTVVIKAPGVVFSGFRVIRSGSDLATDDSCILVDADSKGTEIRDNLVEDCAFGIYINGAEGARVINNHVIGRSELMTQKRGNGIHLFSMEKGHVEGNEIEGARDGILVSISRRSLIKNNKIHDLRYGIHYMYADYNRLEGNVTYGNKAGLAIMFSKELEIESNYSYDNIEFGILFRDIFDSKVIRNVMAGNGKGIFIYNSLFNEIRENVIAENDIGSHVSAGSEDNKVYDNAFVHNKTQVKYVGMRDEDWSHEGKGNYWSDYLGWDVDGDGSGDKPYEANTVVERLIWAYPMIKLLFNSPAVQTIRMAESQFPVIRQAGIVDSAPLMRPSINNWSKWVGRRNN